MVTKDRRGSRIMIRCCSVVDLHHRRGTDKRGAASCRPDMLHLAHLAAPEFHWIRCPMRGAVALAGGRWAEQARVRVCPTSSVYGCPAKTPSCHRRQTSPLCAEGRPNSCLLNSIATRISSSVGNTAFTMFEYRRPRLGHQSGSSLNKAGVS